VPSVPVVRRANGRRRRFGGRELREFRLRSGDLAGAGRGLQRCNLGVRSAGDMRERHLPRPAGGRRRVRGFMPPRRVLQRRTLQALWGPGRHVRGELRLRQQPVQWQQVRVPVRQRGCVHAAVNGARSERFAPRG